MQFQKKKPLEENSEGVKKNENFAKKKKNSVGNW